MILIHYYYRDRNENIPRRAGIKKGLACRVDQRVIRWFGHVERMDQQRMVRSVLMEAVSGWRTTGRSRLGRKDGVNVALGSRRMMVAAER